MGRRTAQRKMKKQKQYIQKRQDLIRKIWLLIALMQRYSVMEISAPLYLWLMLGGDNEFQNY